VRRGQKKLGLRLKILKGGAPAGCLLRTRSAARVILALAAMTAPAQAQHDHAAGHSFYQSWVNKVDRSCCNNEDCRTLREADERTTATGGIEVRVLGQWCPIKPHHYLKSGNAPDWSTSHVCVLKAAPWQIIPACDRLLCYQPKPGI
jgi:hypothetical protein